MTLDRPTGITILAVIQLISSLLSLLGGVTTLLLSGQVANAVREQGQAVPAGFLPFVGGVLLVSGIIGLLLAWGLFTLKGWAWLATLIFQGLSILSGVINLAQGLNAGGTVLGIVISAVIIYYLLRPNVKQAFGK